MNLAEIANTLNLGLSVTGQTQVTGVSHNTSWVKPGYIFVAIRGEHLDAHDFVDVAVKNGAIAIVGERDLTELEGVPYLRVKSARAALADIACALTNNPSKNIKTFGITGTDGKTTTSWMTRYLLRAAHHSTGLLSTVGYELPDGELRQFPEHFTTPESPQVQELLSEMLTAGANAAVIEASSHALTLDRLRGVDWDIAIWTQLTSEHLNFHGSLEAYFAAKRTLIERTRVAILNLDDPKFTELTGIAPKEFTYSQLREADFYATDITEDNSGINYTLHYPGGSTTVNLPMIGRFNVSNSLAAIAAVSAAGINTEQAAEAISRFPGVPGRMEIMPEKTDITCVVDFAHTADSIASVLKTLRPVAKNQLWLVVGSAGGDRDPSKRAPIGHAAAKLSDHAIFTEEDNYNTPANEILDDIARGATENGYSNFEIIPDREDAIEYAILQAPADSIVVIAGKGPEDVIHKNDGNFPWDEVAVARKALRKRIAKALT